MKYIFLLFFPCLLLADLVLFYSPYCPHSRQVLDYIKQTHRDDIILKNVYEGNNKEELRKTGGKMQVPCLVIDGKPLYHNEVITEWLAENPPKN